MSPKQIKSALEQFKKQSQLGLEEDKKREVLENAYAQAMDRINSQMPGFQMLGRKVLVWITCSKRQLTIAELQHALAVETGSTELDPDNLPEAEDMVSACAGLVTVDKESDIIRLVHYTAQEYFERTQKDWFPDAEADITETCVTYLSFSVFESGCCPNYDEFEARLQSNPLYDYAASNWGRHARTDLGKPLILDFLESKAKVSASGQATVYSEEYYPFNQMGGGMTGVHLAAYFGLACITSLLKNGHDVDVMDGNRRTPLWWATKKGHEAIVRLLLKKGADIEARDNYYDKTPLHLAIGNGHEAMVRLLVEKGADIEGKDHNLNKTPLYSAAERGHEAIARLLVEKGADVEARGHWDRTPLSKAVEYEHEAIIRLLLEKGADIEAIDIMQWTPLFKAAENGNETMVRLLLEKGADIETKDFIHWTPLFQAAEDGHEAIVKLLLEKCADVKAKDIFNKTPLFKAAEQGHETIVELLLEKGADVEAKDMMNQTPLSLAIEKGHEAIVRLLQQKSR